MQTGRDYLSIIRGTWGVMASPVADLSIYEHELARRLSVTEGLNNIDQQMDYLEAMLKRINKEYSCIEALQEYSPPPARWSPYL